jgi:general secretion pathway protein A
VIIDEAQNLSPSILEEIRLLSNLEADSFKLLQIILVGQPELKKIITRPDLRQLRQRIGVHCHLEPLSREECEAYVYHRLGMAGNRNALCWHDGTFDILYGYSDGIPRLINVFCDFVLLAAFVEETRELTLELVDEVIGDVAWDRHVDAAKDLTRAFSIDTEACEGISDRLLFLEQRLVCLDAVQEEEGWIAKRLAVHEDLLKKVIERQQGDFGRLEAMLESISLQFAESKVLSAVDERLPSPPGPLPKKRLFGRRG